MNLVDVSELSNGGSYCKEQQTVLLVENESGSLRRPHKQIFQRRTSLEKCLMFILIILMGLTTIMTVNYFTTVLLESKKICLTSHCVQTSAYLQSAMNQSADPCTDFFQFACGSWNQKHIIPEDRSSISTFDLMADHLQKILKGLLEKNVDDTDENEATIKAKNFYRSCMNISQINRVSDGPLRRVIAELGEWPVTDTNWSGNMSVERLMGLIKRNFTLGVLIEEWVAADDRNSSAHIIQIDQMSLGLPGRDYFLQEGSIKYLEAYHTYMTDVAVLLGANRSYATKELWKLVEFEKDLANISLPEDQRIDTGSIYIKISLDDLSNEIPSIDWHEYFTTIMGPGFINGSENVVSYSMPYFYDLGKILANTEKSVIHNYLIWRLVMDMVPHLPSIYEETRAEFRNVLLGVLSDRVRWNRCVDWTNKKMGMAVGALFIKDNFNHESKITALQMIHDIREAFNDLLEDNKWMDKETRLVAKDKANSMNERIGYPDYIANDSRLNYEYSNLQITPDHFLDNLFNIWRFEAETNQNKLRKPVDKDKWQTEPAVVNAFYNPNKNDIVFPAGILQPLFYSQHFPKSLNYGGIGVVIGHEITHGFDDKGRQFDKHGNMQQWWNNRTIDEFREAAQCIIDQYSQYILTEIGLPINGRMTQGENIADNGGLKQAFRAYKKWVSQNGEEDLLPGLSMTHNQLFFLNYAQIWCGSMRPKDALTKIRTAVHPPGPIRVLGSLSNSEDFAEAFNCPKGSKMNPINKCSVW